MFSLPFFPGATHLIRFKVLGLGFSRLLVTGYRLEKVLKALRVLRSFEWGEGSKVRAIDTYRLSVLSALYNQK